MLGRRIKSLRKEIAWSQAELGGWIGVGNTTIAEYEAEHIMPPYEKIRMMANLFGVSVKYLMGESDLRNDETNDMHDVSEMLAKAVDLLEQSDIAVNYNGVQMNSEMREIASGQLKQLMRVLAYLNNLRENEQ